MRNERGYALLEVLLALGLTAVLGLTVLRASSFGLDVTERVVTATRDADRAHLGEREIRALLTGMDAGAPVLMANGRLRWQAAAPGDPAPRAWELRTREGRLVLGACPELSGDLGVVCDETLDLGPVDQPALRFAGPDGVFAGTWESAEPPALVALHLRERRIVVRRRVNAP